MTENKIILDVVEQIKSTCSEIEKIFLFSNKISTSGELTSFKLTLIVSDDVQSVSELECKLYMEVDSEKPYDIVLYKKSEYDKFKDEIGTFAWKIENTGKVLYEQGLS